MNTHLDTFQNRLKNRKINRIQSLQQKNNHLKIQIVIDYPILWTLSILANFFKKSLTKNFILCERNDIII